MTRLAEAAGPALAPSPVSAQTSRHRRYVASDRSHCIVDALWSITTDKNKNASAWTSVIQLATVTFPTFLPPV